MIALVDSDVLLDLGFPREPFAEEAAQLLGWCRLHTGRGFLAWHSLGNVHYLLARHHDDALARRFLDGLLSALDVAPASGLAARRALALPMRDFEDALQAVAAEAVGAQVIVTRNTADFRRSPIPAIMPAEFLRRVRV
jgi:predicted nucleic acid-binding protein